MRITNVQRRKELVSKKGTICCNCQKDQKDAIQFHHIIPLAIGGNDYDSNIVPLCDDCHNLIHHGTTKKGNYNHSELIKKGMQKAKKEGKVPGRAKTTIDDISEEFKTFYYPKIKNKSITITKAAYEMNISRQTVYKYISIIEQN